VCVCVSEGRVREVHFIS